MTQLLPACSDAHAHEEGLSDCRKNYCCPFNTVAEEKGALFFSAQFSSLLGGGMRPLVATHGEIRKLCWGRIWSWDTVKANQSTGQWINQTSELQTVGSLCLSKKTGDTSLHGATSSSISSAELPAEKQPGEQQKLQPDPDRKRRGHCSFYPHSSKTTLLGSS